MDGADICRQRNQMARKPSPTLEPLVRQGPHGPLGECLTTGLDLAL